ncbi:MAG: sigma-54 interaction domain-containing protein [Alphaproteobacteria bacterium]
MRLLIVGNLEGHMTAASKIALARGIKVANSRNIDDALRHVRSGKGADLVFMDANLDLGRFIHHCVQERIQVPVVACGLEDVETARAVETIRQGAREYLPLPPNAELIAQVLESVAKQNHQIIHNDPALKIVLAMADQVAPSEASVLITGESGTGKEVFARYIHAKSKRASGPFVALNCAAIPENLLESELFGHEKGAFSGAIAQRIGKFEEASNGTILLDEISEMDIKLQAKLLRVIQEKEVDRLGGNTPVSVNVRVLATSNRDLPQSVERGEFRQDLYFRLNVINLALPPLRDRPGDIMVLAQYFKEKFEKTYGSASKQFSPDAIKILRQHDWPGNVRELENIVHGSVIMSNGDEILPSAINIVKSSPAQPQSQHEHEAAVQSGGMSVGQSLAAVERRLIVDTYRHCLGNESEAAAILGVSLNALRNRLNEYGEIE